MIDFESNQTQVELAQLQTFIELRGRDCRLVRWAFAYRNLRNKIWWQWRRRLLSYLHKGPAKDNRLHVFWHLRGGIGDCAAHRVCVQAWRKKLPHAVFYYYTQSAGAAAMLFEQDELNVIVGSGQNPLWYKYDLAFEVCLSFRTVHINQKRVQKMAPDIMPMVQEGLRRQARLGFFVRDNYMCDEVLGRFMFAHQARQLEAQRYLSGLDFDVNETGLLPISLRDPKVLDKFDLTGKKYITIHSGVNTEAVLNGKHPLKCWPKEKWREFVRLFKAAYPEISVVQIGGPQSPVFDFADVCLTHQTQLTEVAALIDGALLHIDGESGLAQLTRWLRTKAVVFFAHTSVEMFGLPKNRAVVQNKCTPCMWLLGPHPNFSWEWYTKCLCGYDSCLNLDAVTPQRVLDAVKEELH